MRIGTAGRWMIGLAGALVAAVFLGFAAAAWYVSSPAFREQLIAEAERQTGRDIEVNGAMHLSLWPVLGVSAEEATVSNVEGGQALHLLAAREIDVGLDVAALTRGAILIRRIVLEAPTLNLEVDGNGRGNWLMAPRRTPAPRQEGEAPTAPSDMRIDLLRIADGRVAFADRRTNRAFTLEAVDFTTQIAGLDEAATIEAAFSYNDEPVTLTATLGAPRALQTGAATSLSFAADSRFLTVAFDGEAAMADGALSGALTGAGPSVRELVRWAGYPFPDGEGLERFNLSGRLSAAPQRLSFEDATVEVDAIMGRGDLVLETVAQRPYLTGRLQLGPVDLNRYLNPQVTAEAASGEAAVMPAALDVAGPAWAQAPIRMDILKSVNANLELTTGEVRFFRSQLDRMVMTMALNEGFLAATLHEIALYGGTGTGRVEVDARTEAVRLMHDLSLDGVAVQTFLGNILGFDLLEGSGQVRLALETTGRTQAELVSGLNGRAAFVLNQGAIRGVDIGGLSETIGAVMRDELIQPGARTAFNGLSMSLEARAGRFATQDFQLTLARMRVGMTGVIDLPQRRMDLRFTPRSNLITTPFTVRGPFGDLDFASDLRGRARSEIETMARGVVRAP